MGGPSWEGQWNKGKKLETAGSYGSPKPIGKGKASRLKPTDEPEEVTAGWVKPEGYNNRRMKLYLQIHKSQESNTQDRLS